MNRFAIGALAVASAVVLSACGGGGDGGDDPAAGSGEDAQYVDGGTFTMAMASDPGALDPATAVQGSTNLLASFAYDTLIYVDPEGEVVSGLAESWEVTPNQIVFTLRDDATCADGSAVTPEVVARSVNRVVDPATGSPLLGVLVPADMTAVGDDAAGTLTLTTEQPNPFLLYTTAAIFIVCGEGLDDPSILTSQTSGSGPYQLSESVPDDHYTLSVREEYAWGPDGTGTDTLGVPDTVVLRIVNNESTAANLLLTGEINAGTFTGPDRARVEQDPAVIAYQNSAGNAEYFYNQDPARPGSDPAVREALTKAVNLEELAAIVGQGNGIESTGMATLPPRPCTVDSVGGHLPEYDPAAAEEILDSAGWVPGSDGIRAKDGQRLTLRITYSTDYGAGFQAGAEYQAEAWSQIGVETEVSGSSSAAWSEALFSTGDWDVSTVPIGVSLPSQLLGYLSGPTVADGGSNFAGIDNPDYVELTGQAAATSLEDGGCDLWAQAESALFDAFDVVPYTELTDLLASRGAEVYVRGGLAQPTRFRMLQD